MRTRLLKTLRKKACELLWVEYHGWKDYRKYVCYRKLEGYSVPFDFCSTKEKAINQVDYERREWILSYVRRKRDYRIY